MSGTGSGPKRFLLLGEYFLNHKSVSPDVVESYRNIVAEYIVKEDRTEEEDFFVRDFLSSIVDVKVEKSTQNTSSNSSSVDDSGMREVAQTVKLNELVIVPQKFDRSRSRARKWLDDYERAAVSNSWNHPTMAKYFKSYLTGAALDWFAVFVQADYQPVLDWERIRNCFRKYYIGQDEDLALERSLKDSVQSATESCSSFIARYARMLKLSDPSASNTKLLNALRIRWRQEIIERLSNHQLATLEDSSQACSNIEDVLKASKTATKSHPVNQQNDRQKKEVPRHERRKPFPPKKEKHSEPAKTCNRCHGGGRVRQDYFAAKDKNGEILRDAAPKRPPPPKQNINTINNTASGDEKPNIVVTRRCSTIVASSGKQSRRLIFYTVLI